MNTFKIYFDNKQSISLSDNDMVNSGGEGVIYIKGDFAYKIFIDPKKQLNPNKITELAKLNRDNIIRPIQSIFNEKGEAIGYQMKALTPSKCYPLTRFFTSDFRIQHQITDEQIIHIIKEIYETFSFIHKQNCLIVDGNEMNYLISDDFKEIYFIDVDSYQTPNFPATAYNPNTLAPKINNNEFSPETDWFIFGILFCQIVLGIHPFKGKYTGVSQTFNKRDITGRMEKGISIFHPKVKVNKAVRSFSLITKEMNDWLLNIFHSQKYTTPPLIASKLNKLSQAIKAFDIPNSFNVFEKHIFEKTIRTIHVIGQHLLSQSDEAFYSEDNVLLASAKTTPFLINNTLAFAKIKNKELLIHLPEKNMTQTVMSGIDNLFSFNDQLFVYFNNEIHCLDVMMTSSKLLVGIKNSWPLYHYNPVNNLLLFLESGKRKAYYFYKKDNMAILDLESVLNVNEKIINIKGFNQYLVVKTIENNQYYTKIVHIDLFNKAMKTLTKEITHSSDINFVFKNELLIGEYNDDSLFIGYYKDNEIKKKTIDNFELNKALFLYKDDICFSHENKVYNLTMN